MQANVKKLDFLNYIELFVKYLFYVVWGVATTDLVVSLSNGGIFPTVESWVKILFSIAGLVYFVIRILKGWVEFKEKMLDYKQRLEAFKEKKDGA